jgi:hypothetical protein
MQGLLASFGPAAATDGSGRYSVMLFPGKYRIVIVPEGATDNASAMPGAPPNRLSAITELTQQNIGTEPTQALDLTAAPTRIIEGVATAGISGGAAQGANLEAYPVLGTSSGVLNGVLSASTTPPAASIAVDDSNGHFRLVLDPGLYDFALKPAAKSNFAWWLYPNVRVVPVPMHAGTLDPQLAFPVPLGGTITITMPDRTSQPLRNATLKAYARTPYDGVTQVGTARTDDMGRYDLPLPPGFYTP